MKKVIIANEESHHLFIQIVFLQVTLLNTLLLYRDHTVHLSMDEYERWIESFELGFKI